MLIIPRDSIHTVFSFSNQTIDVESANGPRETFNVYWGCLLRRRLPNAYRKRYVLTFLQVCVHYGLIMIEILKILQNAY